MSKVREPRQDLIVCTNGGPGSIILRGDGKYGVRSTVVRNGILYVHARKGVLVAQFGKRQWLYTIACEQQAQR
jgi:hypothetical protein